MVEGEHRKEMLEVVRRGGHVNITESNGPPYSAAEDIRTWPQSRTWREMRERYDTRVIVGEENLDVEDLEVVADKYDEPNEVFWNPLT